MLQRWVQAGIITDGQAARIRSDVAGSDQPSTRPPSLATELLGYLGAIVVLAGLGLLTGRYWSQLAVGVHVAIVGGAAVVLILAGVAAPARWRGARVPMQAVMWAAGAVATYACLALVASDVLDLTDERVPFYAAVGAGIVAALMWALHRSVAQHAAFFTFLVLAVGTGTSWLASSSVAALTAVWLVGAGWCVLSGVGVVRSRRSGLVLGSIATIVGSVGIETQPWGTAMALLAVLALVGVAVGLRDLAVLAIASIGTLIVIPTTVVHYFPGVAAAAIVLVVVGLLLIGAAVYITRTARAERRSTA
jgi:hypothetical protein